MRCCIENGSLRHDTELSRDSLSYRLTNEVMQDARMEWRCGGNECSCNSVSKCSVLEFQCDEYDEHDSVTSLQTTTNATTCTIQSGRVTTTPRCNNTVCRPHTRVLKRLHVHRRAASACTQHAAYTAACTPVCKLNRMVYSRNSALTCR